MSLGRGVLLEMCVQSGSRDCKIRENHPRFLGNCQRILLTRPASPVRALGFAQGIGVCKALTNHPGNGWEGPPAHHPPRELTLLSALSWHWNGKAEGQL